MIARSAAEVVAKLIFFLVANCRESSDGRSELVVAKSFKPRHGQRSQTKRKLQSEAQRGIAGLGEMQFAGIKNKCSKPCRTESISVADHRVEIIVVRRQPGRGKRSLLHERVVRQVAVEGTAQKPLRLRRLRPVKSQRADEIAECNR